MDIALDVASSLGVERPNNPENFQIEQRAREFETLFLAEMLKPVFKSTGSSELFGGEGPEQEAFSPLLHEQYAKAIVDGGGIGLSDHIKASLIELQSNQSR